MEPAVINVTNSRLENEKCIEDVFKQTLQN